MNWMQRKTVIKEIRGKKLSCIQKTSSKMTEWSPFLPSAFQRRETWSHATAWVNLEGVALSEMSQSQKDRCRLIPLRGVTVTDAGGTAAARGWRARGRGVRAQWVQRFRSARQEASGDGQR